MENTVSNSHHNYKKLSSDTPSGFFGYGMENIVELENFMTQEELSKLEKFAKSNTSWDITEDHYNENGTVIYEANYWKDRVATVNTLKNTNQDIVKTIEEMVKRLKQQVESHFNVIVEPTGPAIVKWPVGTHQDPHADKELHIGDDAGTANDFPHYDIASLFYLNDDYEGGELYFPVQDFKFKPKKGAAYFFPGDMNYIHGITEVTAGTRFTCPFFWRILEHTGEIKPDFNKKYYRVLLDKNE